MAHNKVFSVCEDQCLEEAFTKEELQNQFSDVNTALTALQTALNEKASTAQLNVNVQNLNNAIAGKVSKTSITYGTGNPSGGSDGDIYFKIV